MALSKKAAIIIGTCSIILVGAIVGSAVFAKYKVDENNDRDKDDVDIITSQKAVKDVCQNTGYQETCIKSLSASTNSSQPYEIIKVAFQVTVKEISNAVKKSVILEKVAKDPRTVEAFKTCQKLLDDSVDDLQRTFDELDSFSLMELDKFVDDLKTWLTGAQTFQQTCLDAFENTEGDAGEKMKKLLKVGGELTSNALALVNEISKIISSSELTGLSRRLLSDNIKDEIILQEPKGMKRRLLQATPQNIKPNVTVAKDGSGKYKTITEALKEVPLNSNETFVIYIKAGVYAEYVTIEKRMWRVMVIGDGPTKTRITGNKSKGGGLGTYLTATLVVEGDHFIARDIGVENTAGPQMHQAVALRVTADESIFYNCQMDGYQDTLYVHNHRQFYRDCTIRGTIDFIFGNARAVLQNCKLIIRKPLENQKLCMVTAQGRFAENQTSAIVLQNCQIIPDTSYPKLDESYRAYLGRPWKNFSRTIVMDSTLDGVINPDGWAKWNETQYLDTCWYTEFNNKGAGADQSKRVTWPGIKRITQDVAMQFTPGEYLSGDYWIKPSGVPYVPGRMST